MPALLMICISQKYWYFLLFEANHSVKPAGLGPVGLCPWASETLKMSF
jgi:hypothetical protein